MHDTCAPLANSRCSPLDDPSTACGGPSCLGSLECEWTTGRCASVPRGYGEPCHSAIVGGRGCGEGLRCSVPCGICVDEGEEDDDVAAASEDNDAPTGGTATACGMSSPRVFRTWAGTVRSDHPLLMPRDDAELRSILGRARDGGCAVRPAGSGHSAAGVVAEEESAAGGAAAVSLAEYAPSDPGWAAPALLLGEGEGKASVRVPAGATQLELYATIRPSGYFLPTQTAGWLFALGGIVSNFVHGGAFGKGPIHNHVVSLRVMLWDGTVAIIGDPDDLKYWRNGFGLLGVITAVELEVVRRPHFWSGTLPSQTLQGGWNPKSFETYIDEIKAEYSAAEFFLNPHNMEILAVVQKNDRPPVPAGSPSISDSACTWSWGGQQCEPRGMCSYQYQFGDWTLDDSCRATVEPTPTTDSDCTWDYPSAACRHPEHCSYQFQVGDFTLEESCRLTVPPPPDAPTIAREYGKLLQDNRLLGVNGVPLGDDRLQQGAV